MYSDMSTRISALASANRNRASPRASSVLPTPVEISEIVANNVTGLTDERGGRPDWVEIRNCSSQPLSLVTVSLGLKFFGDSDRMTFTNRSTIGEIGRAS